ncbi:hypothetical protein BZG36_05079 [Bifiguratus adelaidae]|uniref:Uncharacterized protein n=1 Tax=Bifiguratus adelaidae TaxID=1938954 RepID=A0A261XUI8_9FUNG|nr:hypothetical protein BZG36_05079 [Bifiguratus adelaidae]
MDYSPVDSDSASPRLAYTTMEPVTRRLSRTSTRASAERPSRPRRDHSASISNPRWLPDFVLQIAGHSPTEGVESPQTYHRRSQTTDDVDDSDIEDAADKVAQDPLTMLGKPSNMAEEDVCFPFPGQKIRKEDQIDYEALQEWLQEEAQQAYDTSEDGRGSYLEVVDEKSNEKPDLSRKASRYNDPLKSPGMYNDELPTDRFMYYHVDVGTIRSHSLGGLTQNGTSIGDLLMRGNFWIDVLAPTEAEMRAIGRIFHIHPLTLEDISTQESREKVEIFRNYMFVCFRSFVQDVYSDDYLKPLSFYIVVFRHGILTFHFKPTQHPHNVRRRIRQLKEYITVTPDWINYAIIDNITDSFAPILEFIETEVDSIDDLVLLLKESEQSDMLRRIGSCRKKVMQMLRLLTSKPDVIKALIKRFDERHKEMALAHPPNPAYKESAPDTPFDGVQQPVESGPVNAMSGMALHHDVILFLGDIQDHLITMLQNINHYEKILARSHGNYLAQISIELTQTSNYTNEVVGRLSVFATIIVPLNIITGLWGMNVAVPGRYNEDYTWFFWIVGIMFVFAVICLMLAKRFRLI